MNTKTQFSKSLQTVFLLCVATLCLTACGSDKIDLSANKNVSDAVDAATGPLEDLNIRKREIPGLLKAAAINPYARPKIVTCPAVREELAQLDELLGPDMQAKEVEVASADDGFLGVSDVKTPTREQVEKGVGNYAHKTVIGMISSKVNIIPFRSIVRTVTGANKYQQQVTEAYEAGKLRRAYLKGFVTEHFGKKCLDLDAKQKKDEPKKAETADSSETTAPRASLSGVQRIR